MQFEHGQLLPNGGRQNETNPNGELFESKLRARLLL
jgi:hypothetical protein